ncbi:MAG: nitroreductase family protein [Bacteroidetes bacterium]|nr:nitroreductase family protein [Bacteroidota bacterium]
MLTIDQIIHQRRSHFLADFSGEKLPDSLIHRLLENAHQAPSHKATFPWRFCVFSGPALERLSLEMVHWQEQQADASSFSPEKRAKLLSYPEKLSHVIGLGVHQSGKVPAWEEDAALAMAVQNIYLTLASEPHAAGYWSTGNGTGSEIMRQLCGFDEHTLHRGWFLLGHVESKRTKAGRPPLEQVILEINR